MLCFLPPLPAAPRPEPPAPAPLPERAAEAVLFIVIVVNAFLMLAAFLPPFIGTPRPKPLRTGPAGAIAVCGTWGSGPTAPLLAVGGGVLARTCRPA